MPLRFKKHHALLEIKEPRYYDRKVLLAKYKVLERNTIKIMRGAYAGEYRMSGIAIRSYPVVSNGVIDCYAVPLDKLERLK